MQRLTDIPIVVDAFDKREEVGEEHILRNLSITVPLSTTMEEAINGMRNWAINRTRAATLTIKNDTKRGIDL